MNPELRELFEIKEEPEQRKPAQQNVILHVIIRLGILLAGSLLFLVMMIQAKGWDGLGFLVYAMIFHFAWFVFLVIETLILESRNKSKLRNVNLIFISLFLIFYGVIAVLFIRKP